MKETMRTIAEWREVHGAVEEWRHKDDRKPVRLRVLNGDVIELRSGVPGTRADCVDGPRPCAYVRCRWHLWRIDNADRPGKPHGGKRAGTTVRPVWLEPELPPSCAMDFAERGGMGSTEIAKAMGTVRSNVWMIETRERVREAFRKLRELLGDEHGKCTG